MTERSRTASAVGSAFGIEVGPPADGGAGVLGCVCASPAGLPSDAGSARAAVAGGPTARGVAPAGGWTSAATGSRPGGAAALNPPQPSVDARTRDQRTRGVGMRPKTALVPGPYTCRARIRLVIGEPL